MPFDPEMRDLLVARRPFPHDPDRSVAFCTELGQRPATFLVTAEIALDPDGVKRFFLHAAETCTSCKIFIRDPDLKTPWAHEQVAVVHRVVADFGLKQIGTIGSTEVGEQVHTISVWLYTYEEYPLPEDVAIRDELLLEAAERRCAGGG